MAVTNRLVFDPGEIGSAAAGGSNVGSYVRAGTDGALIDSKLIGGTEWLQVATALHAGDGTAITSTGGLLDVNIAGINFSYDYNEDDAAASGSTGAYVLAVRQDTLASSTSADGDFASFKVDAAGALYTNGSQYTQPVSGSQFDIDDLNATDDAVQAWCFDGTGNAITSSGGALDVNLQSSDINLSVSDIANVAIENTATAVSTTAINVVTSALSARKYLALSNEGNKSLYFGKTGVTTVNGFPLHPGMQQHWRIGPSVAPQIIGETGASSEDLRVMELS